MSNTKYPRLLADKVMVAKLIVTSIVGNQSKKGIYIAWSGGKDSTVLLHIVRSIYLGTVPIKVLFADSRLELPETYTFIKRMKKDWSLDLYHDYVYDNAIAKTLSAETNLVLLNKKLNTAYELNLHKTIKKFEINNMFWGNRLSDHNFHQKKHFVKKYSALFAYPLLHFTEKDIWMYLEVHSIPHVSLYDRGYRSLHLVPFQKNASRENYDQIQYMRNQIKQELASLI